MTSPFTPATIPATGGGGAVSGSVSRVGGSDYTTSGTTFAAVDSTNLKVTLSPAGGKLVAYFDGSISMSVSNAGVVFACGDGTNDDILCSSIIGGTDIRSMSGIVILPRTYTGSTTLSLRWRVVGAVTATLRNTTSPQDYVNFGVYELL